MYREIIQGACVLLAVAVSACQSMPAMDGDAEAARIRALDAAWVEAIAAGDPDKIMTFYSSDAVFMPPNAPELRGDDIRKEWASMRDAKDMHLSFAPARVEVDAGGEMAIDVGTYEFSMTAPDGSPVRDHGKYAQVWEKRDGAWKCAVDIYNSSEPLPPLAAAHKSAKKRHRKKK